MLGFTESVSLSFFLMTDYVSDPFSAFSSLFLTSSNIGIFINSLIYESQMTLK